MKIFTKRFISAFLAALICVSLAACEKNPQIPEQNPQQEETLSHFSSVEEMQKAFDDFILDEFTSSLEGDYLSIHHTLLNPQTYGIDLENAEIIVGESVNEDYIAKYSAQNLELKTEFEKFDYELLRDDQQETYLLYKHLLENAIKGFEGDFPYMGGAFTPMQGLQGDIPSVLMEYNFYTLRDVDAYIELMSALETYVDDSIEYSKVQAQKGYFMSDIAANSTMEYCKKIIEAGMDSAILDSVVYNLENCDLLDETQKADYIKKATEIFENSILPAYQKIYDCVNELKNPKNNSEGLSKFKNGKEYYEYLFRVKSGSERSVSDSKKLLLEYIDLCVENILNIAENNPDLYEEYIYNDGGKINFGGIDEMILELEEKILKDFPEIEAVDYSINYLDPEVAIDGVTAYYVVPPIDSKISQKIKVNPNADLSFESPSTFTILAHEGIPGHLYQTNFVMQNVENPFRKSSAILGYSEGYSTYCELISLNYLSDQLDPNVILLEQFYTIFQNCLIALCDIGIHYENWSLEDMYNFMNNYTSMEDVSPIYEQLQADPAAFQAYYMGCVEFMELRRNAQNSLGGKFNLKEFHRIILEGGDLPFSVLEMKIDEWVKSLKSA